MARNTKTAAALLLSLGLVVALFLGTAGVSLARPNAFPCRWNWDLRSGLPQGKVVAGFDADCSNYRGGGTITISALLLRWDPQSGAWKRDRAQTKRWTNLKQRRYVELSRPCIPTKFKAQFHALLRSPGGSVVGTVSVKSRALRVVVPRTFTIG